MAADFEMRKAASSIMDSIREYAKENPGIVAGMLGAGGVGALGGALYGDDSDRDESAGSRILRRTKNALIGGVLGAGSMAALGHGLSMLRGKSTTSTHNDTTPKQEKTNEAAAPVGGSTPADNAQHADGGKEDGSGMLSFVSDVAGPAGWLTGGVVTGIGSGKTVSKWLGRGETAAANRLIDATAIPGSTIDGLSKYKGKNDPSNLISKDLRQFLNPKTGGGVSQLTGTMPASVDAAARAEFLAKNLDQAQQLEYSNLTADVARDEFLKKNLTAGEQQALALTQDPVIKADRIRNLLRGHNPALVKAYENITDDSVRADYLKNKGLLEGFNNAVDSKGRARWLAQNLTPDHLSEYARVTNVNPILSEMPWKGNLKTKMKMYGLNNLRRVRKVGGPLTGLLTGTATTFGIPALLDSINDSLEAGAKK